MSGLKPKLWLIIRVNNNKKLNPVMLNGDDNENGFKTDRFVRAARFFVFQLPLAVVLHDHNAVSYD